MKNKKIGIITTYQSFTTNYGAVLQSYALSRQLTLLGYMPAIMPYISESEVVEASVHSKSFLERNLNRARGAFDFHRWKQYVMLRKQDALKREFKIFNQKHLPLYRAERISIMELEKIAIDYGAFISGSDQVWSTRLQGNRCDRGMFLKFVPDGVRRIAYAPSLGSSSVPSGIDEDIRASINRYDAVSVREVEGARFLAEVTGRSIPVVLDPTLLLQPEEYDAIISRPEGIPEKYMLVYRFGDEPHTFDTIVFLAKKLGLSIIELPSSYVSLMDNLKKRFDIGPDNFLWLIRNAALVCTDSYHATVFCIINHTPFLTFLRQNPDKVKQNMNARVLELLSMTGLTERLVKPGQDINTESVLDIEFSDADYRIIENRIFSLKYLTDSLGDDRENVQRG